MPFKQRDIYLYAPTYIFHAVEQLEKLHNQFAHPSAGKLYKVMKRAGLETVYGTTHKILEEIVQRL